METPADSLLYQLDPTLSSEVTKEPAMRKAFTVLAAALIALPILAEQKQATPTPTPSAERGKPSKDQRQMTGKVIRVLSQQGRATFIVQSNGKEFTFSAANLKTLPKVGDVVDITYTQTPSGPLEATTVKSSKSNTSC